MGHLGFPELIIIFFIVLLVFGARRLPEAGAGLGKAIRSFKDALTTSTDSKELDEPRENKDTSTDSKELEEPTSREKNKES